MSMSLLDPGQVLKMAADEADQAIRVNVVAFPPSGDVVQLLDGVGGINKAQITAANALKVDGSAVTQPVTGSGTFTVVQATGTNLHTVVDSSALPTGASTSALQTTGNTSLSSILANQTNGTQHTVVDSGTINSKAATPTALTVTQSAITVGTSAVRLTVSGSAPSVTRVLLAATPDNASTASFYIGSATVTNSGATRGFQIVGGQPFVANNDAGDYYIVSSTAGQTVFLIEQS